MNSVRVPSVGFQYIGLRVTRQEKALGDCARFSRKLSHYFILDANRSPDTLLPGKRAPSHFGAFSFCEAFKNSTRPPVARVRIMDLRPFCSSLSQTSIQRPDL